MLSATQIVSETWGRDFAHKLLATQLQAWTITQLKAAHLFGQHSLVAWPWRSNLPEKKLSDFQIVSGHC